MTVLLWIAVLVGGWCVASVATALIMGTFLRRRHEATDPRHALRPLAVGPIDFWAGITPDIPDTPESLDQHPDPALIDPTLTHPALPDSELPDPALPAPRSGADQRARDPEGVG